MVVPAGTEHLIFTTCAFDFFLLDSRLYWPQVLFFMVALTVSPCPQVLLLRCVLTRPHGRRS
jgi:hypothetical protein